MLSILTPTNSFCAARVGVCECANQPQHRKPFFKFFPTIKRTREMLKNWKCGTKQAIQSCHCAVHNERYRASSRSRTTKQENTFIFYRCCQCKSISFNETFQTSWCCNVSKWRRAQQKYDRNVFKAVYDRFNHLHIPKCIENLLLFTVVCSNVVYILGYRLDFIWFYFVQFYR